ncbi:G2/mitotic-specific cyclin-B3-like [Drosophila elegans]|uniref:G2/mitotic-specific cyclin-B3-like n=1 Tax=Drosophila elegans TaxID=30023 RepID=UPI0007E8277A|nr:G2/mitotic-specific cyclin-B3-like [Drosophila elegans]
MAPKKGKKHATKTGGHHQGGVARNPPMALDSTTEAGRKRKTAIAGNMVDPNDAENMQKRSKPKADDSPIKKFKVKRSALGNLTNNANNMSLPGGQDEQQSEQQSEQPSEQQLEQQVEQHSEQPAKKSKAMKRGIKMKAKKQKNPIVTDNGRKTRESNKKENSEEYSVEHSVEHGHKVGKVDKLEEALARPKRRPKRPKAVPPAKKSAVGEQLLSIPSKPFMPSMPSRPSKPSMPSIPFILSIPSKPSMPSMPSIPSIPAVPPNVEDFDRKHWDDPLQVSTYAMDIFEYLKGREPMFPIVDYMPRQIHLTAGIRTILVDWMVVVQQSFEFNDETLYLAMKIVDLYLSRKVIKKDQIQLLGVAAYLIACKYDEWQPPSLIRDFLYLSNASYNYDQVVQMELETLRTIEFELGVPLACRFLRRYASCAEVPVPTLTLANYILAMALMDYATIAFRDSQMACAVLFMALRMSGGSKQRGPASNTWSPTLVHYSGYQLAEFARIVPVLNAGLHRNQPPNIKTIREKYTLEKFHEVAKVPLLTDLQLLQ